MTPHRQAACTLEDRGLPGGVGDHVQPHPRVPQVRIRL